MIKIENLSVNLPGFSLSDINLNIKENRFFTLMGPSGAGKTVLLETIAGLVKTCSGNIHINGKDATNLPPEKRGIGIVYQDCSLFPHLSVKENIKYGLRFRARRSDEAESKKYFESLIDVLNIGHLLKRRPAALSGGERQRTALARALIVNPGVLLLDEPFTAIDTVFRSDLQQLLKRLQQSLRTTFFMVTHSFSEAMSLADNAAVIQNGRIQQQGSMIDIFKKPCSEFVADFVGMKNVYHAEFNGSAAKLNGITIQMGNEPLAQSGYIAIRPEDIVLSKSHLRSSIRNSFKVTTRSVTDKGFTFEVETATNEGTIFKSLITRAAMIDLGIRTGEEIFVSFKAMAVHNF